MICYWTNEDRYNTQANNVQNYYSEAFKGFEYATLNLTKQNNYFLNEFNT